MKYIKFIVSLLLSTVGLLVGLKMLGFSHGYVLRMMGIYDKDLYLANYKVYYNENGTIGLATYEPGTFVESYRPGIYPQQTTAVNSLGFADKEPDLQDGRCNILLIGDSYVAAHQVPIENKFGVILETKLRQTNPNIQIISMGMDGTSIVHQTEYVKFFHTIFGRYPDFILIPLISNDIRDSYYWNDIASFEGYYTDNSSKPKTGIRTTVVDVDKLYKIVHPHKGKYDYLNFKQKANDNGFEFDGDWNSNFRQYLLAAVHFGLISKASFDESFFTEKFPVQLTSEGSIGLYEELPLFWHHMVRAYEYSISEFLMIISQLHNENKIGVFTTHSLEFYNRFNVNGFSFDRYQRKFFDPWEENGVEVQRLIEYMPNTDADDFHFRGDGHLSKTGHLNISYMLFDMFGEAILETCR